MQAMENLGKLGDIAKSLQSTYKECVGSNAAKRPNPSDIISRLRKSQEREEWLFDGPNPKIVWIVVASCISHPYFLMLHLNQSHKGDSNMILVQAIAL